MPPDTSAVISQAQAINSALDLCMEKYADVIVIGEGVPDPNGIFGTTAGLLAKYGPERVFDMPLSENGITGVCIGAALSGLRPVMVHQRIEFSLLAMDQLINNAAKWNYIFANQATVSLVVRMIAGQGWGQGAQPFQGLQNLFAQIPGLKVVMPVTAYDAKGMLISAIEDKNPVIFIEHRGLHSTTSDVPDDYYFTPLDKAKVIREGRDVTIAAFSFMVVEAMRAAEVLSQHGIEAEVIDMRSLRPLDTETVLQSLAKTGRLLVADSGHLTNSIASELIACVVEAGFECLKNSPKRIISQDYPVPEFATGNYAPVSIDIAGSVLAMFTELAIDMDSVKEHLLRAAVDERNNA